LITIQKPDRTINEATLTRFTNAARRCVGLKGEVAILITSSREMRRLNRLFRGKDKPTDVISFPAIEVVTKEFAGDLAISVDIAKANARNLGHSTEEELAVLILHGVLHLAGYDHEKDNGEMAAKESRLRDKLSLPTSLIARTLSPKTKRMTARKKSAAARKKR
jgi:probable rRNA maturation factor